MAPHPFKLRKLTAHSYKHHCAPFCLTLANIPKTTAQVTRPLRMDFEDLIQALIFFHLQGHASGRRLLQPLKEDCLAREHLAPKKGIAKGL
ncbi:MAG: hypothetical protein FWF31_05640 [Desulfobulbus sp.]|nr:hypothetical protein [Desulfobulbus sp.]